MKLLVENCHKHPDRVACCWREALVLGESDRVPLCLECAQYYRSLGIIHIYPLNERIMQNDKYNKKYNI